jgi:anthranilate synthase/aminodeoxychorismate synthase-like glutamine amidotransferase
MKKVLVIDNFDSFTFNLVDFFEQAGCKVFVQRNNIPVEVVEEINPDLLVLSPGPSVPKNAGNLMEIIDEYHDKCSIFGVCLGFEALIEYFGGTLKFVEPVHGKSSPISHDCKMVFEGLPQDFMAGRYHSLAADTVPKELAVTASFEDLVMGIRHQTLPIEAVLFHPESILTMSDNNGLKLIKNVIKNYVN